MDTEDGKDKSTAIPAVTPIKGGDSGKGDKGSKSASLSGEDNEQTLEWVRFLKNTPNIAFDGDSLQKVMELMDIEAREGTLPQDQNALTSALRSEVVEKFDQLMQSPKAAVKWYMADEQMTEM
jgi:hypothetical protein